MASSGAAASGAEPQLGNAAPAVGASREDDLFLTTQVAETGSHLEEALRNRRRLE
jgi:diketogulonate reductase-like aldo/keto reductase